MKAGRQTPQFVSADVEMGECSEGTNGGWEFFQFIAGEVEVKEVVLQSRVVKEAGRETSKFEVVKESKMGGS